MIVEYYKHCADHIRNLTKRHRIKVQRINKPIEPFGRKMMYGESIKQWMQIGIPDVNNEETYFIALHEIGHCLHPLGCLPGYGSMFGTTATNLTEEAAAWSWAFAKNKLGVKATDCEFAKFCYGCYTRNAAVWGDTAPEDTGHLEMKSVKKMHELLTAK